MEQAKRSVAVALVLVGLCSTSLETAASPAGGVNGSSAMAALVQSQIGESPFDRIDAEELIRFHTYLDQVRDQALGITIDGKGEDWQHIPSAQSPEDPSIPGGKDITRLALAPLDDGIYIAIFTREAPSNDRWTFFIDLDVTDLDNIETDFAMGFFRVRDKENHMIFNTPHGNNKRQVVPEIQVKAADMIEVFIPWYYLENSASDRSEAFREALVRSTC